MKNFLFIIIILSSLILIGCGKKPKPSPEEVIPEIPEPTLFIESDSNEDLTNIVIEVNDGTAKVSEVNSLNGIVSRLKILSKLDMLL